jgi:serine/threonine protein phosphatase 1
MIVVGDVHGCYYTLLDLLSILPQTTDICFVGDLIDRGPYSKDVLQFVIDNNYISVRGNHEDLISDVNLWFCNGGIKTVNSFKKTDDIREATSVFMASEEKKWIDNLPLLIKEDGVIITHSFAYNGEDTCSDDILWGRDFSKMSKLQEINIFGHTPAKKVKKIQDKHYCIDTACVFGYRLSAIDLKTMQIYSVKQSTKDKKEK